ncbi:hypothetical protein [Streptomyces viridochromogenes]|uniref:hypothetical protein n=1 Tax=Streptomyces viridochromogenes TaxID=1938 RepID=UPI001F1C7EC4|nr:hypothetical protein [Streptomyces viridochromogenes]
MTPEIAAALTDAGIHRMNVPRRYGGYRNRLRPQVDAVAEIAEACGSTAFRTLIQAGCSYIAALFPDEAQDEIFTSPDVKVGGTLIPDATAVRSNGGYVVNGTSAFATGCHDADWHLLTVPVASGSGDGPPEVLWTAVPMAELEILDDWYVSGPAGSGSDSVVARDVVVPAHRVLPVAPLPAGEFPSRPMPTTRSPGCPSCCCSARGRRRTRSAWPGPHSPASASAATGGASPTPTPRRIWRSTAGSCPGSTRVRRSSRPVPESAGAASAARC